MQKFSPRIKLFIFIWLIGIEEVGDYEEKFTVW